MSERMAAGRATNPKILIIGAGMSGMLMGIRLQQAGIHDFEILEKAHTLGGTWRENTYPGLQCDVPGYMYAYSFEPNPECSRRFATGADLQAYFERVFAKYRLARHTRFNTAVESATWEDGGWTVVTGDGERRRADILVAATGVLHHPNVPDIPGLNTFAGTAMHSAQWRHDAPIAGRRVGIIGTGSTAVQIVSAIAGTVGHLDVFQRTAQWIVPAGDREIGERQRRLMRRHPVLVRVIAKYYEQIVGLTLGNIASNKHVAPMVERIARLNLRLSVRDPVLRAKLTPDYKACCKRIVFADNFYPAIQQPNVSLVTDGIERIEAGGVRTRDGKLHALDVLVLATGFRIVYSWPIRFTGRNGRTLDEAWRNGAHAYRSLTVPEFPNLFFMQGPHSPVGNFSLIGVAEVQADYIMQIVGKMQRGELKSVEPREDATRAFNAALRAAAQDTVWASGCKSWYLDANGVPALWPWSYDEFRQTMKSPRFEDFVVTKGRTR